MEFPHFRRVARAYLDAADPAWAKAHGSQMIPTLIEGLAALHPTDQPFALAALKRIDPNWNTIPAARREIPTLIRVVLNAHGDERAAAEFTLARIDPKWPASPEAQAAIPAVVYRFLELRSKFPTPEDTPKNAKELLDRLAPGWSNPPGVDRVTDAFIGHLLPKRRGENFEPLVNNFLQKHPDWPQREAAKNLVPRIIATLQPLTPPRTTDIQFGGPKLPAELVGYLDRIAPGPAQAPELVELLGSSQKEVLDLAGAALVRMKADARPAVPALIDQLVKADAEHAAIQLDVLSAIDAGWAGSPAAGAARPAVRERLDKSLRLGADFRRGRDLLIAAQLHAAVTPEWLKTAEAKELAPELARALLVDTYYKTHWAERFVALLDRVDAVWRSGVDTSGIVRDLIEHAVQPGLHYPRPERGGDGVLKLLPKIDPKWHQTEAARDRVPDLVLWLSFEHDGASTARAMLDAIDKKWAESPTAVKAVPKLLHEVVSGYSVGQQVKAAGVLSKIDPKWATSEKAREAISKLVERATTKASPQRDASERVLTAIDPDWAERPEARAAAAAARLILDLTDESEDVCKWAAGVLKKIDPAWAKSDAAKASVPLLIKRFDGRDTRVHRATVAVLKEIGPPARDAVNDLIALLRDASPDFKDEIRAALKAIQADPKPK